MLVFSWLLSLKSSQPETQLNGPRSDHRLPGSQGLFGEAEAGQLVEKHTSLIGHHIVGGGADGGNGSSAGGAIGGDGGFAQFDGHRLGDGFKCPRQAGGDVGIETHGHCRVAD